MDYATIVTEIGKCMYCLMDLIKLESWEIITHLAQHGA